MIMLPEHKTKPELDDQQKEELIRTIAVAMFGSIEVHITVWDPCGAQHLTGYILGIDKASRRLRIGHIDHTMWIEFDDILHIVI